MSGPDRIKVTDLYAGYGGVPVVRGASLSVGAGEMVALIGPNGSGKSTTLLTISGMLKPLSGSINVDGWAPSAKRPHLSAKRGLGHVAEDRCIFGQLTVGENIALGNPSGRTDWTAAFRYFPALEGLKDRQAGLLSGGEQQMLAIARALQGELRALMIDELSLGLAPLIVADVLSALRRICADTGLSILLVEQHIDLVLAACDRAYVLTHGTMSDMGRCAELINRRDILEASYLGDSIGLSGPPPNTTAIPTSE